MIIVTGATGALNGATVDLLLESMPASEIVVAVRDPAKAQRFADRGVAVTATMPTPTPCRARSTVPTSCCWSPRAIRAQTQSACTAPRSTLR